MIRHIFQIDRLYDDGESPLQLTIQRELLLSTDLCTGDCACNHTELIQRSFDMPKSFDSDDLTTCSAVTYDLSPVQKQPCSPLPTTKKETPTIPEATGVPVSCSPLPITVSPLCCDVVASHHVTAVNAEVDSETVSASNDLLSLHHDDVITTRDDSDSKARALDCDVRDESIGENQLRSCFNAEKANSGNSESVHVTSDANILLTNHNTADKQLSIIDEEVLNSISISNAVGSGDALLEADKSEQLRLSPPDSESQPHTKDLHPELLSPTLRRSSRHAIRRKSISTERKAEDVSVCDEKTEATRRSNSLRTNTSVVTMRRASPRCFLMHFSCT